jgi:hypothetical protein
MERLQKMEGKGVWVSRAKKWIWNLLVQAVAKDWPV